MDVEQHDVGLRRAAISATASSTGRLADDVDQRLELGPHAGAEQRVVVDDQDRGSLTVASSTSSTSVPSPARS